MEQLRWLHISDLHLRSSGDTFSQSVAMAALVEDVKTRLAGSPPAFVVVTGDVAFSGRSEEYAVAEAVFENLSDAVGLPPSRFYFVPGNHDVDRTRSRLHHVGACADVQSEADVDRILGAVEDVGPLIERQRAFWDFVGRLTDGQARQSTPSGLGYFAALEIDGVVLGLIAMNSAWLSGRDGEETRLLIGERQIIEALALSKGVRPVLQIALAHHPVEWLFEWDQQICRRRLLAACEIFHRGHLHDPDVSVSAAPEAPCLTRFYGNAYNLIDLDLGTGSVSVQVFLYDPSYGRYEAGPVSSATVEFARAFPGTRTELRDALSAAAAEASRYQDYFVSLILGEKDEVPVLVRGTVEFLVPGAARELVGSEVLPAEQFLRLRNLLRLHGDETSLEDRVGMHRERIASFAAYLDGLVEVSPEAASRVTGPAIDAAETTTTELPHTSAFLEELVSAGRHDAPAAGTVSAMQSRATGHCCATIRTEPRLDRCAPWTGTGYGGINTSGGHPPKAEIPRSPGPWTPKMSTSSPGTIPGIGVWV